MEICKAAKDIDQQQKEAILQTSSRISYDNSLVTCAYDTIPVKFFYSSGNPLKVSLTVASTSTTDLFRISQVSDDCTIKLRLIELKDGKFVCTKQTCFIDLNSISCMQCFEPICCIKV